MSTIVLGNSAPIEAVKTGKGVGVKRVPLPELGDTETTFSVPNHIGIGEALSTVTSVFHSHHSDEDPAWVESDDETLERAIASQFHCPVGRPKGWAE